MNRQSIRVILALWLALCIGITPASAAGTAVGDIAYKHISQLSDTIGSRVSGTVGEAAAADYITQQFRELGYPTVTQSFGYTTKRNGTATQIDSQNIIAVKAGSSRREIILAAHYDSVAVGKGADDNASAIGVMLEIAERLKSVQTPCTIRFIAFGGEEDGLKGSKHYVSQMSSAEIKNTVNMIVMDSLIAGDNMYVYGDYGYEGILRNLSLQIAEELKLGLMTQPGTKKYPGGTTGPFSDQAPFEKVGIPYTYYEATNWTLGAMDGYTQVDTSYGVKGEIWHTPYDTLQYIESSFPGRVQNHLSTYVTIITRVLTAYTVSTSPVGK